MKRKNILVTGSNRSGSTWVGKVLSQDTKVDNIIEPLNINRIQRFKKVSINNWFLKVDDTAESQINQEAKKLFDYYMHTTWINFFKYAFQSYEGHNIFRSIKKKLRRTLKPVKLVKDPQALFSIPWLVSHYHIQPLVLIRHPAAYVLSIKEKEWWFNFDDLLQQEHFFEGDLKFLKEEVLAYGRKSKPTIIENASLMWKICYYQVALYQKKYPDWYFIKHETLSQNPVKEYKKIFNYFEIAFTSSIENYIVSTTRAKVNSKHSRDAMANAIKWKQKLSKEEKQIIYSIVKDVSGQYYEKFA